MCGPKAHRIFRATIVSGTIFQEQKPIVTVIEFDG